MPPCQPILIDKQKMVAVLKRSVSPPQKVFNLYGIYLRSAPARFFDREPGTGYRSHDDVSMVNMFLVIISWLFFRSSFRTDQRTHRRPFCLANSLGIAPKVPFEQDFGRDSQRLCQAERSLISPLVRTKRAS